MDKAYWNECLWRVDKAVGWEAAKYMAVGSRVYDDSVKRIENELGFRFPGEYFVLLEMQKYFGFNSFELYTPRGISELRKELGIHNVPFSILDMTLYVWPLYSGQVKKVLKVHDGQSKLHFVADDIVGWAKSVVL